jgi:hypothetical protein
MKLVKQNMRTSCIVVRSFFATLIAVTLGLSVGLSQATPENASVTIAKDSFNYDPGPLSGKGAPGDGWEGAWTGAANSPQGSTVAADGLTYSDGKSILGSPNDGKVNDVGFEGGNFRRLASTIDETNTIYISFIAKVDAAEFWGLSLHEDGAEKAFMGKPSGAANWGIAGPGISTVLSSTPTSTQSLLVYRFDFAADGVSIKLYVNPGLSSEPADADATSSAQRFRFNEVRLLAGGDRQGQFDELRIGTSYAAVTSAR